uniref:G-protein coupled receptors family 3 profile domain-containing protein n=1 Tax=Varanus komodoensis TaxID=61221 RepID=A0A8D2J9I6_VARKO
TSMLCLLVFQLFLPCMVCKGDTMQCFMKDPFLVPHEWYQPGGLIVGEMVSLITYEFSSDVINCLCCSIVTKFYQHALALAFAVDEINKDLRILPNVSLGFHILDSYTDARMTYRTTLDLVFKSQSFVPNYKCGTQKHLVAAIGGLGFDTAVNMAGISGYYKIPQFADSYSLRPSEKETIQIHSFYHMAPYEDSQFIGIIRLLQHFEWMWIGVVVDCTNGGEHFVQVLEELLSQNEICSAFTKSIPQLASLDDVDKFSHLLSELYEIFTNSKVSALIMYGESLTISWIRTAQFMHDLRDNSTTSFRKVWIVTAQIDFILKGFQHGWGLQLFQGAISVTIPSKDPPEFRDFLQRVKPNWNQEDGFLKAFWEQAFDCSFADLTSPTTANELCTGEEKLENLPAPQFEMDMTGHSYSIYNAVHAVAHALHTMMSSRSKGRDLMQNKKLHSFLLSISFNNAAGEAVSFSDKRVLKGGFDIMNLVTFSNFSFKRVKVGRLDPKSPEGKELTLNGDAIVWPRVIPISLCNERCRPGYQKRRREGEKFCCYDCAPCPEGKISNQTALVLSIFLKHNDTPLVRANNRGLSYMLLVSLLLCFLSPLLFLRQPGQVTCLLRQPAFAIIFSVAVSCVLAKTALVSLAFRATKPGSRLKNWVGKTLAHCITLTCSSVQAGLCAMWLASAPPFPDLDSDSVTEAIVLQCNEGSVPLFFCVLSYMGLLALASFTVAFLARRLPDSFNEAKFITFSMLVFCSVWVSFVPTYLSTRGKDTVAVEIFSILSSAAGLLGCIFAPKCYIILLRPEMNCRDQLMRKN